MHNNLTSLTHARTTCSGQPCHEFSFHSFCSLIYNNATDNYSNATGVEVRVPGFGDTSRVEYLDADAGKKNVPQWNLFVDYFVERGYERGKTIRAAPYDWRLAPSMHGFNYSNNSSQLVLRGLT